MKHCIPAAVLLSAVLLLTSCSPKVSTVIKTPEETKTTVSCAIPTVMSDMMESLTGSTVQDLISCDEITSSLALIGIETVSCTLSSANLFSLTTDTMAANKLPFEVQTTARSITITVSPESLQHLVAALPDETASSIDLLMAPVLTGEKMDTTEYTSLIGAIYGSKIAAALEESVLTLDLTTPAPATLSVDNGAKKDTYTSNSTRLTHDFSVVRLLCLSNPAVLTISW